MTQDRMTQDRTLLIFDCDGVLVDSELLAHAAVAELLTRLGRPMTVDEALGLFAGKRLQDMLAAAEAALGGPIPAAIAEQAGRELLARLCDELQPVEGVRAAIAALPYRRCVASSSSPERIRISLETTGLAPLFGNVFSAEQVANGKPAPDLFLLAAGSLGASPADCIVIEDSPLGIAAARGAGMRAIGFLGGSHVRDPLVARIAAAGADRVIRRMAELPAAVEAIRSSART